MVNRTTVRAKTRQAAINKVRKAHPSWVFKTNRIVGSKKSDGLSSYRINYRQRKR